MSMRKPLIIILALFVVLFVGLFVGGYMLDSSDWLDPKVAEGQYTTKTSLGDEFLVKYETLNFPDYQTLVDIFDAKGQRLLLHFATEVDFQEPEFDILINTQDLRCYKIESNVIYKKKGKDFKGVSFSLQAYSMDTKTNEETKEYVEISKKLVATKQWIWIKECSKLLLSTNDAEIKKTLERNALGEFTEEEIEINKDSDLKKEDMQTFAKKVLEEKINDIVLEKN